MELKEKEKQLKEQNEELTEKVFDQNAEIQSARLIVQEAEAAARKAEDALFDATQPGPEDVLTDVPVYVVPLTNDSSFKPSAEGIRSSMSPAEGKTGNAVVQLSKKVEDLQARLRKKE